MVYPVWKPKAETCEARKLEQGNKFTVNEMLKLWVSYWHDCNLILGLPIQLQVWSNQVGPVIGAGSLQIKSLYFQKTTDPCLQHIHLVVQKSPIGPKLERGLTPTSQALV